MSLQNEIGRDKVQTRRYPGVKWRPIVVAALKRIREKAGLQQRPLCRLLGVHLLYVWEVEHNQHDVRLEEFVAWCQACGADPAEELRVLQRKMK